jgi:tetratricopeptide (TPR) repeat protein
MKNSLKISALLVPALLLSACGPKRTAQGLMDDPRTHADRGKQYYDKGEFDRAKSEYRLALELNKNFAPALGGLAMVKASERDFDSAEALASKAISKADGKIPDGYIAKGVVITEKNRAAKDADWFEDAESAFRKAIKIDRQSGEAYYRMGYSAAVASLLAPKDDDYLDLVRKSGDAYRHAVTIDKAYATEANAAWSRIQKVERALPGSRVGRKIAMVDSITRADAAALFIAELGLDRILSRSRGAKFDTGFHAPEDPMKVKEATVQKAIASDIKGHWAENFIVDAVGVGIRGLQVQPDGRFQPDRSLTRAEFAFLLEDALMIALGDKSLATKFIGSPARFSDVAGSSPYANAIDNMVDKNILQGEPDGTFGATKPVSGADALLAIRTIKELRK